MGLYDPWASETFHTPLYICMITFSAAVAKYPTPHPFLDFLPNHFMKYSRFVCVTFLPIFRN